jgi:hypothetical protein
MTRLLASLSDLVCDGPAEASELEFCIVPKFAHVCVAAERPREPCCELLQCLLYVD